MSKRRLGLSTRAIHTPPLREGSGRPVVGPIVASTTVTLTLLRGDTPGEVVLRLNG